MNIIKIQIFLMSLFWSVTSYCVTSEVALWTEQVLSKTLQLNINSTQNDINQIKLYYSPNAWDNLNSFFQHYTINLFNHNEKIIALNKAQVTDEGNYSSVHYWRINQQLAIIDLHLRIDLSAIIFKNKNPIYLIHSISILQNAY